MSEITFAVHAPSAESFWQSWIAAGICTAPHEYADGYRDHIEVRDWGSGQITSTTLVDGEPVTVVKPGWFANVRVTGTVAAQFMAGLPQTDAEGNMLPLWERTHAASAFGLEWRDRDETTGFPAGYVRYTEGGVVAYTDMSQIATPYEVRQ
jgi:hypothetical protein